MRKQTVMMTTGKRKRNITVVIAVALIAVILSVCWRIIFYVSTFVPPEFDSGALAGTPVPEESLNYGSIDVPTGFTFSLCGTMYQQQDASLILYFTNPETNDANLRCEIKSEDGTVLYESGVIRPGEYVERLSPIQKIPNEAMPIELSVYAYAPDTWYSMGTANLNNTLQPY